MQSTAWRGSGCGGGSEGEGEGVDCDGHDSKRLSLSPTAVGRWRVGWWAGGPVELAYLFGYVLRWLRGGREKYLVGRDLVDSR